MTISVTLEDESALWACYMPFLIHGGLFVATDKLFHLEQKVEVLLSLLTHKDLIWIPGSVVWITPTGDTMGRQPGFGLQFDTQHAPALRKKIESLLNGKQHYMVGVETHTL